MSEATPSVPQTAEDAYRRAAGAVLRRLRNDAGGSLREFAEQVGVAHTSLHAVERAETTPSIDTLARVAASRGLSFPAILALILDELVEHGQHGLPPLSKLLESAASLSDTQIDEIIGFSEYLKFRDGMSDQARN